METILNSEIFWPLITLVLLHAISLAVLGFVLKMFNHAKDKQYELLSTFAIASGGNAAVWLHKGGRGWVALYIAVTIFYIIATVLFLIFQPHIL